MRRPGLVRLGVFNWRQRSTDTTDTTSPGRIQLEIISVLFVLVCTGVMGSVEIQDSGIKAEL